MTPTIAGGLLLFLLVVVVGVAHIVCSAMDCGCYDDDPEDD